MCCRTYVENGGNLFAMCMPFSRNQWGNGEFDKMPLGMTDLFAFDGDARLPISKKENEYIFVNVYFEWGGKTYCYLCDDE